MSFHLIPFGLAALPYLRAWRAAAVLALSDRRCRHCGAAALPPGAQAFEEVPR
ncbi:hypothetical protein [Cupriavidus malaysiensis]|uniref:hypothetical protein n=1 Tax=Cupriavidus malaysiensis TaxID=367825 RepID=UPI0012FFC83D|nr:hypothetical protein [Cupriavidus malaysiensis]